MAKKFVIYDPEWGVYLGNCMGLGFWSNLDSVGQEYACVFDSIDQAMNHVHSWDSTKDDPARMLSIEYREVDVANPQYASIAEIERAGMPPWLPDFTLHGEDGLKYN